MEDISYTKRAQMVDHFDSLCEILAPSFDPSDTPVNIIGTLPDFVRQAAARLSLGIGPIAVPLVAEFEQQYGSDDHWHVLAAVFASIAVIKAHERSFSTEDRYTSLWNLYFLLQEATPATRFVLLGTLPDVAPLIVSENGPLLTSFIVEALFRSTGPQLTQAALCTFKAVVKMAVPQNKLDACFNALLTVAATSTEVPESTISEAARYLLKQVADNAVVLFAKTIAPKLLPLLTTARPSARVHGVIILSHLIGRSSAVLTATVGKDLVGAAAFAMFDGSRTASTTARDLVLHFLKKNGVPLPRETSPAALVATLQDSGHGIKGQTLATALRHGLGHVLPLAAPVAAAIDDDAGVAAAMLSFFSPGPTLEPAVEVYKALGTKIPDRVASAILSRIYAAISTSRQSEQASDAATAAVSRMLDIVPAFSQTLALPDEDITGYVCRIAVSYAPPHIRRQAVRSLGSPVFLFRTPGQALAGLMFGLADSHTRDAAYECIKSAGQFVPPNDPHGEIASALLTAANRYVSIVATDMEAATCMLATDLEPVLPLLTKSTLCVLPETTSCLMTLPIAQSATSAVAPVTFSRMVMSVMLLSRMLCVDDIAGAVTDRVSSCISEFTSYIHSLPSPWVDRCAKVIVKGFVSSRPSGDQIYVKALTTSIATSLADSPKAVSLGVWRKTVLVVAVVREALRLRLNIVTRALVGKLFPKLIRLLDTTPASPEVFLLMEVIADSMRECLYACPVLLMALRQVSALKDAVKRQIIAICGMQHADLTVHALRETLKAAISVITEHGSPAVITDLIADLEAEASILRSPATWQKAGDPTIAAYTPAQRSVSLELIAYSAGFNRSAAHVDKVCLLAHSLARTDVANTREAAVRSLVSQCALIKGQAGAKPRMLLWSLVPVLATPGLAKLASVIRANESVAMPDAMSWDGDETVLSFEIPAGVTPVNLDRTKSAEPESEAAPDLPDGEAAVTFIIDVCRAIGPVDAALLNEAVYTLQSSVIGRAVPDAVSPVGVISAVEAALVVLHPSHRTTLVELVIDDLLYSISKPVKPETDKDIKMAAHALKAAVAEYPDLMQLVYDRITALPLLAEGDVITLTVLLPFFRSLGQAIGTIETLIKRALKYIESPRLAPSARAYSAQFVVEALSTLQKFKATDTTLVSTVGSIVAAFTAVLSKPADPALESVIERALAAVLDTVDDDGARGGIINQQEVKVQGLLNGAVEQRIEAAHRLGVFSGALSPALTVGSTIRLLADPASSVQVAVTDLILAEKIRSVKLPSTLPDVDEADEDPETDADAGMLTTPMRDYDPGNVLYRSSDAFKRLCKIYGLTPLTVGDPARADVRVASVRTGLLRALCQQHPDDSTALLLNLAGTLDVDTVDGLSADTTVLCLDLMRRITPACELDVIRAVIPSVMGKLAEFTNWISSETSKARLEIFKGLIEHREMSASQALLGQLGSDLHGVEGSRVDLLKSVNPSLESVEKLTRIHANTLRCLVTFMATEGIEFEDEVVAPSLGAVVMAACNDHDTIRSIGVSSVKTIVRRFIGSHHDLLRSLISGLLAQFGPHSAILLGNKYRDMITALTGAIECLGSAHRQLVYSFVVKQLDGSDSLNKKNAVQVMPNLIPWFKRDMGRTDFPVSIESVHRKLELAMKTQTIPDSDGVLDGLHALIQ
ncbi:hypothetical protein J8273_1974 [Carpediemonas membranifera]|uniref:Uncharacterized protein n=1 Tax=Carpediemonas membranifera TaxID=201153 RepID=A0A8J6B0W5_9EUKA|nr:hypothetical protein J8273_1974 [Carpediemonas membranifera]|eukprot:KAG9396920.1 hypothetical protein J8273_1974 [Carpediemonas membranifera]